MTISVHHTNESYFRRLLLYLTDPNVTITHYNTVSSDNGACRIVFLIEDVVVVWFLLLLLKDHGTLHHGVPHHLALALFALNEHVTYQTHYSSTHKHETHLPTTLFQLV